MQSFLEVNQQKFNYCKQLVNKTIGETKYGQARCSDRDWAIDSQVQYRNDMQHTHICWSVGRGKPRIPIARLLTDSLCVTLAVAEPLHFSDVRREGVIYI